MSIDTVPITQSVETLPEYGRAIANALATGYKYLPNEGQIIGLKGQPLSIKQRGKQMYPTVSIVTPNMPRRFYVVPAHKIAAYALWGEKAFKKGVHTRHLNGVLDISSSSLALGTASENELDKSIETRSRVSSYSRSCQPLTPYNSKLTEREVKMIREICDNNRNINGRVKRGVGKELASRFGVSKCAISQIAARITYTNV
jgi:hypothetical protein